MRRGWVFIAACFVLFAVLGPTLALGAGVVFGGAVVQAACKVPFLPSVVSAPSSGDASSTSTLPQATISYLDKRGVKKLAQQNMERYLAAQKAEGVPWQVMAALHYREAGMNPGSSISNGAPLGSGVNVDGVNVGSDANKDAINMAGLLKRLAKSVYGIDVTKSTMTLPMWGEAFLAYNRGSLYKNKNRTYDQSPYVMNGVDASHMNMHWIDADTVSGVDGNKAGAMAVFEYLGATSSGDASGLNCDAMPALAASGKIVAPLDGKMLITDLFGPRFHPIEHIWKTHNGLDIIGGSNIHAIAAGKVVFAGYDGGLGNEIKIDHGSGFISLYGHMSSFASNIHVGTEVTAGQIIGVMGTTGESTGPHLHLQIWNVTNGKSALSDPEALLANNGIIIPRESDLPKSPYIKAP